MEHITMVDNAYNNNQIYNNMIIQNMTKCVLNHAQTDSTHAKIAVTRSSAIAEGPRDASCQLKSCQLPRNSAETTP